MIDRDDDVTPSSGNVLADLGLDDAEMLEAQARMQRRLTALDEGTDENALNAELEQARERLARRFASEELVSRRQRIRLDLLVADR